MANVICPQCGESYHETTDAYRPGVVTTGNMLRLKKQYVLNGWSSFPEHEGMMLGDLFCPGCGGMYSDNGMVRVDMAQLKEEFGDGWEAKVTIKTSMPGMDRLLAIRKEMDALMAEYDPDPPTLDTGLTMKQLNDLTELFVNTPERGVFVTDTMASDMVEEMLKAKRKPGRQKR